MSSKYPNVGSMGGLANKTQKKGSGTKSASRRGRKGGSLRRGHSDLSGAGGMQQCYHYLESGLDSVFLKNGYHYHDGPQGRTVSVDDIDGLHQAIGRALLKKRLKLTGKEFRFLRTEMLLSQSALAQVLGVKELTVARWEKGHSDIPLATEVVVRQMYSDSIGQPHHPIRELLDRIADLEDKLDQELTLRKPHDRWLVQRAA